MGFFSWLRDMFSSPPPRPRAESAPATCLYCGAKLRSPTSDSCRQCGRRWEGSIPEPANDEPAAPAFQDSQPVPPRAAGKIPTQSPTRAQLEAGELAPQIAEHELRDSPLQSDSLSFGRRDRIPTAADPRTKIIDEAMIARGLITPERLAEIHRVGEEMDRIDPPREHFMQRAEAAAELDRKQREERRRQRKAEALKRRQDRECEIAQRKASDIVFLGRGVSRSLGKRNSDPDELKRRGLPLMATPADVAEALDVSVSRLRWLAFHNVCATRVHYVDFEVAKRCGGVRRLAVPHQELARCQRWICKEILGKLDVHPSANGFVRRRSIVTNASPHVDREIVINLDLEEFFPSITFPRVLGLLQRCGYSPAAATVLALLCTECSRQQVEFNGTTYYVALGERSLPQGACTSPALSNLIAYKLDCRLAGLASQSGWTYTRYADDLTFSTGTMARIHRPG